MSIAKVWNFPNLLDSQVKREIPSFIINMYESQPGNCSAADKRYSSSIFQKLTKYQDLDWVNIKQNAVHTISIVSCILNHT